LIVGSARFRGKAQQGQGLTAGTLDLRGSFVQQDRTTGGHGEFEPGPTFLVKFTSGNQTVSFDHPGTSPGTESYFTNVLVVNEGGVSQSTHAFINGGTMIIGGPPASAGSRATWTTGGNTLFLTSSLLQVRASGQLTVPLVPSRGTLDLTGGSCAAFNVTAPPTGNLDMPGTVAGGSCTTDPSLTP
jgi:hypothetical protein